mgnify:CR=1 FL=1
MAVIVTVLPAAFLLTFTTPFLSTVATFLLLVFQVTNLFFAFFGKMLVINLMDLPAAICLEIPLIAIFLIVFLDCCVFFLLSVSFFCSIFIPSLRFYFHFMNIAIFHFLYDILCL